MACLLLSVITACGGGGDSKSSSNGSNNPPTALAGSSITTEVGRPVTLSGTGIDPDGDQLTYVWRLSRAPLSSTATLRNANSESPNITPDVMGTYVAELVVSDGKVESAPSETSINALVGNIAPVSNPGSDQLVGVNDLVMLNGNDSSDPNGDSLLFSWTFDSLPVGSSATINNENSPTPSFTADVSGDFVIQLIVSDGALSSAAETVTVTASAFSVNVSWAPNSDNPAGYVVYVGPTASSVNRLARVLVSGASNWSVSAPGAEIGAGVIYDAIGNGTQACFAVKAYNGVGPSLASDSACLTVPAL